MVFQKNLPVETNVGGDSQIAHAARIETVLHQARTNNKNRLAIFPENFENSERYIELALSDTSVCAEKFSSETWKHLI